MGKHKHNFEYTQSAENLCFYPDDKNYIYPSLVPLASAAHGGDDVGVFAIGKELTVGLLF